MKRFLSLSVALVMGLMLAIPAFATAESEVTQSTADTDTTQIEAPLVLVTEGELQTLKPVNALSDGEVYIPDNPDAPMMVLSEEDDDGIMPLDSGKVHIYPTDYTSSTEDYNDSFSCNASDGNRLNIWVKNNGSKTVVLNVDWSKFFGIVNEEYDAVEIPAGKQHTMTFYYEDGKGIDGNWNINVTTLSGGTIDITVSARQYQYNG